MRSLTQPELQAIRQLAESVGAEDLRTQFLADLEGIMVEDMTSDGAVLRFHIEGFRRPPDDGQDTFRGSDGFPVEGFALDGDGMETEIIVYVQERRLYELEFIRHDNGDLVGIDWRTFRVK
jgi:hypothetical protein